LKLGVFLSDLMPLGPFLAVRISSLWWAYLKHKWFVFSNTLVIRLYLLCAAYSLSHQSNNQMNRNWKLSSVVSCAHVKLEITKEQGFSTTSPNLLQSIRFFISLPGNNESVLPRFAWHYSPNLLRFWCVARVNRPWSWLLLIVLNGTVRMSSRDKIKQTEIYLLVSAFNLEVSNSKVTLVFNKGKTLKSVDTVPTPWALMLLFSCRIGFGTLDWLNAWTVDSAEHCGGGTTRYSHGTDVSVRH